MTAESRPIDSLTVADCERHSVWKFAGDSAPDETCIKPVKRVPVDTLTGKLVATQVLLANGQTRWALIGNIVLDKPELTKHFVGISIENDGQWFQLSRYFDYDYAERGPEQLARFLGLDLEAIFPISFDVSAVVRGNKEAARGRILVEPEQRLTREEIVALAVP